MAEFTRAHDFKTAAFDAAVALWAEEEVQVAFGHPGMEILDDCVSFGEISTDQTEGPMGGRRSRNEVLTLTVIFSCFRAGGGEMESVAAARAFGLLGELENYFRKTDTSVGGTVEWCFLSGLASDGSTDPDVLAAGRLCTIAAQFTARARITTT